MATCNGCGITPVPPICTPVTTDTPVFFRPAGAHVPVPGFIRVTVAADCTQTVQHLDASLVAYGSLQPLVDVPYVSALGASGGGGGGGAVTIANGAAVPLGATTDTAAPADGTGNYTLLAAAKRALLNMAAVLSNWTTLLARVPALVSGRVPVDGSGVTQPTAPNVTRGSGAVDANTQRVTLASDGPGVVALSNIDTDLGAPADAAANADGSGTYGLIPGVKRLIIHASNSLANWTTLLARIPAQAIAGLLPVDTLAVVGLARQLAAGAASANTALTASCRRISIFARNADIRYSIGASAQTASSTSHYIATGERLDMDVPANANIAVIRAGTTDGTLEVTELL